MLAKRALQIRTLRIRTFNFGLTEVSWPRFPPGSTNPERIHRPVEMTGSCGFHFRLFPPKENIEAQWG